jgi:hypothetical protein
MREWSFYPNFGVATASKQDLGSNYEMKPE